MTRDFQAQLVTELMNRLRDEVLANIASGKVPEHWDGIELRQYIADKTQECILVGTMGVRRLRSYRNAVITMNL